MWNLKYIKARNICSFQKLEYTIEKNVATLIFGENEDDGDNQRRNGSGKSAFLEAIGFGITGEPFRKVGTVEDIIRDDEDYAETELGMYNQETGMEMTVKRRIGRGESQKISVDVNDGVETSSIPFVSVQDMNRRILEILGVSKDDLYNNYLLNSNRFRSFFDASDKEKKEIINTFSNGILVDEAIDALKVDINNAGVMLEEAGLKLAEVTGRINAYQNQIDTAKEKAAETEERKKETIESYRKSIADERMSIRENNAKLDELKNAYSILDSDSEGVDSMVDEKEMSFSAKLEHCKSVLSKWGLDDRFSDWDAKIKERNAELSSLNDAHNEQAAAVSELKNDVAAVQKQLDKAHDEYDRNCKKLDAKDAADLREQKEIEQDLEKYSKKLKGIKDKVDSKSNELYEIESRIKKIEAQIRGSIECPSCHHRFILDGDRTGVDDLVAARDGYARSAESIGNEIAGIESEKGKISDYVRDCELDLEDIRSDIRKRKDMRDSYSATLKSLESQYDGFVSELEMKEKRLARISGSIDDLVESIGNMSFSMVHEAVEILDTHLDNLDRNKKSVEQSIAMSEKAIEAYKDSIRKLEESTVADTIAQVSVHLDEAEKERLSVEAERLKRKDVYDVLKEQEELFIGFKTHLANTKINSIAQITNQVLKDVGSTLRVRLSGYTTTKTGKVRDKISISVIRDGEDKGSYLKCSNGEKARIMFANIVAMHRMTNLTSPSGGLNLICIDEIMDSCEEAGIMGVADIANKLGITLLLITQGMTSESYPHKLVVRKYCGVSTVSGN